MSLDVIHSDLYIIDRSLDDISGSIKNIENCLDKSSFQDVNDNLKKISERIGYLSSCNYSSLDSSTLNQLQEELVLTGYRLNSLSQQLEISNNNLQRGVDVRNFSLFFYLSLLLTNILLLILVIKLW